MPTAPSSSARSKPAKTPTPASLGYRMPAEWAPHSATWLSWPSNKITWPGKRLKDVQETYRRMILALTEGEVVNLCVADRKEGAKVHSLVSRKAGARLKLHPVKPVDTWIRDYGPIFLKHASGRRAFTKWTFNAWGGKYADLAMDNGVVNRVEALRSEKRFDAPLVLEGGSIDMDGEGTCLTTEQCLLNPNRNPTYSREEIEAELGRWLGVKKTIWLKEGIEGDDTDGHIDDITRFVAPRTVVTATEKDPADKNAEILSENLHILNSTTDAKGRKLRVVELPMPGKVGIGRKEDSSNRLPASYANFYIANSCVLLPVYSHRNDKLAKKIITSLFPNKKIVSLECSSLVYGLGSIHCVTQQEPR